MTGWMSPRTPATSQAGRRRNSRWKRMFGCARYSGWDSTRPAGISLPKPGSTTTALSAPKTVATFVFRCGSPAGPSSTPRSNRVSRETSGVCPGEASRASRVCAPAPPRPGPDSGAITSRQARPRTKPKARHGLDHRGRSTTRIAASAGTHGLTRIVNPWAGTEPLRTAGRAVPTFCPQLPTKTSDPV